MARLTNAQREWRPGMKKKRRSIRTMFASTVLTLEAFLVFFAALTVYGLRKDIPGPLTLGVGIGLAVVCILACALLTKPLGYWIGWGIQGVLFLIGFIEPTMFIIAILFTATWWYAVAKGRAMDRENAERDRLQAEWEAAHPEQGA